MFLKITRTSGSVGSHINHKQHTVVLMNFNYIKWIYVKVEKEENTGSHHHVQQQQKSAHVPYVLGDYRSPILQADVLKVPYRVPSQRVHTQYCDGMLMDCECAFSVSVSEQDGKQ